MSSSLNPTSDDRKSITNYKEEVAVEHSSSISNKNHHYSYANSNNKQETLQTPSTPTNSQTAHLNNTSSNQVVGNVVSRLKSWIKKTPSTIAASPVHLDLTATSNRIMSGGGDRPTSLGSPFSLLTTTTPTVLASNQISSSMMAASPNTNTNTHHTPNALGYNPPLSIDFVRKIKRPTSVPIALDYTSNQVFQGSLLEEWLMQTLDEHIHSAAYINQSFNRPVLYDFLYRIFKELLLFQYWNFLTFPM